MLILQIFVQLVFGVELFSLYGFECVLQLCEHQWCLRQLELHHKEVQSRLEQVERENRAIYARSERTTSQLMQRLADAERSLKVALGDSEVCQLGMPTSDPSVVFGWNFVWLKKRRHFFEIGFEGFFAVSQV